MYVCVCVCVCVSLCLCFSSGPTIVKECPTAAKWIVTATVSKQFEDDNTIP